MRKPAIGIKKDSNSSEGLLDKKSFRRIAVKGYPPKAFNGLERGCWTGGTPWFTMNMNNLSFFSQGNGELRY